MKLLKRFALPMVALSLTVVLAGCGTKVPPEGVGDDVTTGQGAGAHKKLVKKLNKEQAEALYSESIAKTYQALSLATTALNAKQVSHKTAPAKAAPPSKGGKISPEAPAPKDAKAAPATPAAPATSATSTSPAAGAAAEPAKAEGPVLPELKPSADLANELLEQAYALIDSVKKDSAKLKDSVLADKKDPRLDTLSKFIDAVQAVIVSGASLEPRSDLILKLEEAAKTPAAAPAEAPKADAGKAPEAPKADAKAAKPHEAPKPAEAPKAPAAPAAAPTASAPSTAGPSAAPAAPTSPAPAPAPHPGS